MQIVVIADGITQKEFQDKPIPAGVRVQFVTTIDEGKNDAAAYFYLLEEEDLVKDITRIQELGAPVFVHAVSTTLKDLADNCIRICGWRGFLLQDRLEVCASPANIDKVKDILDTLGWHFYNVPDIIGLIAPRTTALLINEAYLIVNHATGGKQQIDEAIKLTAYFSSGPFELAEKIGLQKIFNLLVHLTAEDRRYSPAQFLQKEISDLGATA